MIVGGGVAGIAAARVRELSVNAKAGVHRAETSKIVKAGLLVGQLGPELSGTS